MGENLPYHTHRKHRYYTQDHPLTAKQRGRVRRLDRIRATNNRDASFGKINWAAYDHQQMWDMIHSSDPAAMGTTAHRWGELAAGVDSATAEVHKTVQKLLMSWRGGSAVRAAESASKLTAWGAGASGTMRDVGVGLDTYTSALLQARNHMPEPVYYTAEREFREGYDVKASSGPSGAILADQLLDDHLPSKREASKAKAEAVRVMERYESVSKGVHDDLPSFADAPEVIAGDGNGSDQRDAAGRDGTTASSVPAGGTGLGGIGGATSGAGFGGSALGAGTAIGGGGAATGSGAVAGSGSGAAAAAAQNAVPAGARGGTGMYPPGAGQQQGAGDGDHRNRYSEGLGVDFLDDLPPAYPPVLGE